jgi:hypothetical protein
MFGDPRYRNYLEYNAYKGVDIKVGLKQTGRRGAMGWNAVCKRRYTQQTEYVRSNSNNG